MQYFIQQVTPTDRLNFTDTAKTLDGAIKTAVFESVSARHEIFTITNQGDDVIVVVVGGIIFKRQGE